MFQTSNLYQNDPKWKSVPLGNQSTETIGTWGCLLTSMTMMLNGLGYHETPVTVNDKMKANGGFQGALIIPVVLPQLYPNAIYRNFTSCTNSPAPVELIDAAVTAGKPVIVQVDWSPSAGIQTHWVLIKDKVGNDYSIYDPYQYQGDSPGKDVLLTQRYRFQGANAAQAISGVVWFEGTGVVTQPPPPPPVPIPVNALTFYTTVDDLALRDSPDVSGKLYKRLMAGVRLVCLEDPTAAKIKVGKSGQWLSIQDPAGQQGYVAAWYTSDMPPAPITPIPTPPPVVTPTPSPSPAPPDASGSMIVSPTKDGLTLRTQPVISPQTVIKYEFMSEKLTVLEPTLSAAAKIGVQGQWLNVRDSVGQTGYIAAWFVQVVSGATPPPTDSGSSTPPVPPTPSPAPTTVTVHTTAEGVALRSQPIVSNTTLIKRLPTGTRLVLIDPNTANKIGAVDQWLQVQDPVGANGYIAAWFVAK